MLLATFEVSGVLPCLALEITAQTVGHADAFYYLFRSCSFVRGQQGKGCSPGDDQLHEEVIDRRSFQPL
jgi:hypothetical protein